MRATDPGPSKNSTLKFKISSRLRREMLKRLQNWSNKKSKWSKS